MKFVRETCFLQTKCSKKLSRIPQLRDVSEIEFGTCSEVHTCDQERFL